MTYSEHELEFTFAKNLYACVCVCVHMIFSLTSHTVPELQTYAKKLRINTYLYKRTNEMEAVQALCYMSKIAKKCKRWYNPPLHCGSSRRRNHPWQIIDALPHHLWCWRAYIWHERSNDSSQMYHMAPELIHHWGVGAKADVLKFLFPVSSCAWLIGTIQIPQVRLGIPEDLE